MKSVTEIEVVPHQVVLGYNYWPAGMLLIFSFIMTCGFMWQPYYPKDTFSLLSSIVVKGFVNLH